MSIPEVVDLPGALISGITIHGVELVDQAGGSGRQVRALSTLTRETTLIHVPKARLLNLKTVGREAGFEYRRPPCSAHPALSVYLLAHRSDPPEGTLGTYIASLPRDFSSVPLTWTPEECELLPASTRSLLSKQRAEYDAHLEAAKHLCEKYPAYNGICLDNDAGLAAFQWAWLCVNTRTIWQSISPSSPPQDNYALCPYIDMVNHAPTATTADTNKASPVATLRHTLTGLTVVVTSGTPISKGDEVCISYGAHANDALLVEYGFCLENNADDVLNLDATIDKLDLLKPSHRQKLRSWDYEGEYTIDIRGEPSFRTLVALRLANVSEHDCHSDGSDALRAVELFKDGHSTGRKESGAVRAKLLQVLDREREDARHVLDRLTSAELRRGIRTQLEILWRTRLDLIELAAAAAAAARPPV
ncbi:hypothetical protein PYCC9005_005757 [Savitreella phatthalungensis]